VYIKVGKFIVCKEACKFAVCKEAYKFIVCKKVGKVKENSVQEIR